MPGRKSVRKNKKQTRRTRGGMRGEMRGGGRRRGGCGCTMKGGSGSPGLEQLPGSRYYPFNPMNSDPNYFSLNTRLIGGSRRTKRVVKNLRRVRGGGVSADIVNTLQPVVQNTVVGANMFNQTLPYSVLRVPMA